MSDLPICPRCGGDVRRVVGTDGRSALTCSVCGATYALTLTDVPPVQDETPVSATSSPFGEADPAGDLLRVQEALVLPQGLTVSSGPERLVLSRRWWGIGAVFNVIMAVFWNGFMLVWYALALSAGDYLMAAFGTVHAAVGVGLAYVAVGHVLNRTQITLTPLGVSVRHGPVPWRGQVDLGRDLVAQVYVRRDVSTNNKRQVVQHAVVARRRDGGDTDLVTGLSDLGAARYLERRVEEVFGIEDRPISGEVSRG